MSPSTLPPTTKNSARRRRIRAAAAALLAGTLFLASCADDDGAEAGDSPDAVGQQSETDGEETTADGPGIGDPAEGNGMTVTVNEVTEAAEVDWDDLYEDEPTGKLSARDDGKLILVHTTVENTWQDDIMPACGDVATKLHGDNDARYGSVDNLFAYPGNPGCDNLGVGFDEEVTFVFEIPEDVEPVGFEFRIGRDHDAVNPVIRIDEVSDESERDRPSPTRSSSASSTTARTTTQATPAQQAPTAPSYMAPCAPSQLNQPAQASDGTWLVCTSMGAAGQSWVYGPAPQGAGTASDGAVCTDGESGGQDEQGRMMMCVNGQWVYGP